MFTGSLMGTSRFFTTRVSPDTLSPKYGTYGAGDALAADGDTASVASGCAEAIVVPVNTLTATSGTQTASVRPGWRRIAPKTFFVFMYSRPLSQLRWIHLATDGTPFALLTNSMYQPGGAMFGLLVTFRLTLVPRPEIDSATYRWFGSDWCVTAAGRMSSAETIFWFVL